MKYDPKKHHRRSIRLQEFDYTSPGWYFVTICTDHRHCIFGDVVNGKMKLNEYGRIVENEWLRTARLRPHILQPNSLGSIIGQFKSVVTKKIRKMGLADFKWQRNYHEHVYSQ